MNKFSKTSQENLATCNIYLQRLFYQVLIGWDCSVVCGYRNEEHQTIACEAKKSNARWPNSKHNCSPSFAVDVYPYPVPRTPDRELDNDSPVWKEFMIYVKGVAAGMNIQIRCGGEFKGKMAKDWSHFELVSLFGIPVRIDKKLQAGAVLIKSR